MGFLVFFCVTDIVLDEDRGIWSVIRGINSDILFVHPQNCLGLPTAGVGTTLEEILFDGKLHIVSSDVIKVGEGKT